MNIHYKYRANIHQNDKVVVACNSNDLSSIKKMLQNIVERELSSVNASVIDNDLDDVVFSINKAT